MVPARLRLGRFRSRYFGLTRLREALAEGVRDSIFDRDSADIVLSTQVLEHVRSPVQYLVEARRLCRPAGRMILSTHGMFKYHPHPGDYWRWTAEGLRQQLAQAGWRTERTIGVLGFAAAAFHLLQNAAVYVVVATPMVGTGACHRDAA